MSTSAVTTNTGGTTPLSFSGLASGLDTSSIIQALLSAVFLEIPAAIVSGVLARRGITTLAERAQQVPPD